MVVNRREILFVYAVKDANPNGDPANENQPRFDDVTETVFVSDARIKRTIRDHLIRSGEPVLISKKTEFSKGKIVTPNGKKLDLKDDNLMQEVQKFLDVKLFGMVPAGKGGETMVNLYGPVQFRFGHSLNSTEIKFMKGSSTPRRAGGEQTGKFTEKYFVPFAVIGTYGIVNELVAEEQNIDLSEEDVNKMLVALWKGTEELQSSSKAVHTPLLLLSVKYKREKSKFIGNLDDFVTLVDRNGEDISYRGNREMGKTIRRFSDFKLDLSQLLEKLRKFKGDIEKIEIKVHPELGVEPELKVGEPWGELYTEELRM